MPSKPVLEIDEFGNKLWYLNSKLYRTDGPAIEYSHGSKFWYLNGKSHRVDGPAIERSNGDKFWFLNDKKYSFKEWLKLTPLSDQEKTKLGLEYTSN